MLPIFRWYRRFTKIKTPGATSSEKNILVLLPREKALGTHKTIKGRKVFDQRVPLGTDKRKGDGGRTQRVPEWNKFLAESMGSLGGGVIRIWPSPLPFSDQAQRVPEHERVPRTRAKVANYLYPNCVVNRHQKGVLDMHICWVLHTR